MAGMNSKSPLSLVMFEGLLLRCWLQSPVCLGHGYSLDTELAA